MSGVKICVPHFCNNSDVSNTLVLYCANETGVLVTILSIANTLCSISILQPLMDEFEEFSGTMSELNEQSATVLYPAATQPPIWHPTRRGQSISSDMCAARMNLYRSVQGEPQITGLLLSVDYLATVGGRKACYMLEVLKFSWQTE